MRVRMFQSRFADLILKGHKRQTIRPTPKRMPKPGDFESWREWTGSLTRELAQVKLKQVREISISHCPREDVVSIGGELLPLESFHRLAIRDGFSNWPEMAMWFYGNYGDKFKGILIEADL